MCLCFNFCSVFWITVMCIFPNISVSLVFLMSYWQISSNCCFHEVTTEHTSALMCVTKWLSESRVIKHTSSLVVRMCVFACLQVCSYRHPGVGQDLLGSETSVNVHLQHLTDQHLRNRSCDCQQPAVKLIAFMFYWNLLQKGMEGISHGLHD